ncbi:arginyltransferase [Thalassotalea sp. PLHSN55]|uniref:arginyltransferase n=1 Tax=Thalassotalea sp. PLHSN55 TaxID=3435888 RepID=UPI003F82C051
MNTNYQFGLTRDFPCSYLPDREEKLLVAVDPRLNNAQSYELLMSQGFRRSGDQVYRPQCTNCQACQSIRILASQFKPSKSQKRLLKKSSHFTLKLSKQQKPEYFPLYEKYINTIHQDGSMFPANVEQYSNFILNDFTEQIFIELWHDDVLINVAVTDLLSDALSAVYTFYDPDYRTSGLGVLSILKQVEVSISLSKQFLYLGYQIDDCQKMNYKNRFFPHQRLWENSWQTVNK